MSRESTKVHYLRATDKAGLVANAESVLPFLTAEEISAMSASAKAAYVERAFLYWRKQGFPYPSYSDERAAREYLSLRESSARIFLRHRSLRWSPVGLGLANSFHPHMWFTKCERFRTPCVFHAKSVTESTMKPDTDSTIMSDSDSRMISDTFGLGVEWVSDAIMESVSGKVME